MLAVKTLEGRWPPPVIAARTASHSPLVRFCGSAGQVASTALISSCRQRAERSVRPACSWAIRTIRSLTVIPSGTRAAQPSRRSAVHAAAGSGLPERRPSPPHPSFPRCRYGSPPGHTRSGPRCHPGPCACGSPPATIGTLARPGRQPTAGPGRPHKQTPQPAADTRHRSPPPRRAMSCHIISSATDSSHRRKSPHVQTFQPDTLVARRHPHRLYVGGGEPALAPHPGHRDLPGVSPHPKRHRMYPQAPRSRRQPKKIIHPGVGSPKMLKQTPRPWQ